MWKPDRNFWRNLAITVIILGVMYGFTIYNSIQERKRITEIHKQSEEVYGRMRRAVDNMKNKKDTLSRNGQQQKYRIREQNEDTDPYDNPDFDDLVPGEEYDEEFVDRSEVDPELYK